MCGLYGVVYVADVPMCITDTFSFACGGILGHADVIDATLARGKVLES